MAENFVLDGEIIAYDASGRPSFARLQKRMLLSRPRDVAAAMARVPVRAVFFDCLALEGHDLRKLGLLERKECLGRILPPAGIVQAQSSATNDLYESWGPNSMFSSPATSSPSIRSCGGGIVASPGVV